MCGRWSGRGSGRGELAVVTGFFQPTAARFGTSPARAPHSNYEGVRILQLQYTGTNTSTFGPTLMPNGPVARIPSGWRSASRALMLLKHISLMYRFWLKDAWITILQHRGPRGVPVDLYIDYARLTSNTRAADPGATSRLRGGVKQCEIW